MIKLTYEFATQAEALAFMMNLAGAGDRSQPANVAKDTAAPKPTKPVATPSGSPAAAPAPASTPAAPPASSSKPTASGALDYEKDVKPLVLKLGATKGRDAVVATFGTLGVAKGTELTAEQLPGARAAFEAALGAGGAA